MRQVKSSPRSQTLWLFAEWGALYLGVPAGEAAGWWPISVFALLLLMAVGCGLLLLQQDRYSASRLMRWKVPNLEWRRILIPYAASLPCLTGLLWCLDPAAVFSLVLLHPKVWVLVLFLYPLISVFPQEMIYRAFFFERYRPIFGEGASMRVASAAAFSFAHIVFHNWPAVVLTSIGGWLFARTYQRTSSLLLVSIEHSLYGCALFTIGYGKYFFDGTLSLFRG